MYGYIPANHFNIDLCLDTISVLNRTGKDGYQLTPYELFTGEMIDYERVFRCRWGDLILVKKPKGISSDLGVTGEWAMVVQRSMDKDRSPEGLSDLDEEICLPFTLQESEGARLGHYGDELN